MNEHEETQGKFVTAASNLFPGYFALVMATGIVSIAAYLLEMRPIAWGLLAINIAAYTVLWALLLVRLVRFSPRVKEDITDHARGPGFFTVAAGTCVFGSQLVIVAGQYEAAIALWFAGLLLWAIITYTFFTAVTLREEKPQLEYGLNGAWLISAVATQSISVLATLIAGRFGPSRGTLLFLALCAFLIGCMLYLLLIVLIFYRFIFLKLTTDTLTPPYWINMGAVAITTLAGARLILSTEEWPFLGEILPFLKGFTLFFWAWGTWWIPLLFILGFWRHVYMRYPLRYDPQYWGLVFPLGMYTACTFQLSKALGFEPLMMIPRVFVFIAFAGWLAAAAGLVHSILPKRRG